jgi:hypothetical protein
LFLSEWAAHGSMLNASVIIVDHRLLVIAVDERNTGASGCSIDSQVSFLKGMEKEFNIDLFRRDSIFYIENEVLKVLDLNEFIERIESGVLSDDTRFYNTTINNKGQMKEEFIVSVKDSWLRRMIRN